MFRIVPLLWCLLLPCLPVDAAGTRELAVAPGLVVLRAEATAAGADISWESRQPATLPLQTFEGGTVCVFCEHTVGRQIVVVSDVIDWDARKRDRTTWIITVGTGPTPVPPPGPAPQPIDYGFVEFTVKQASLIQPAGIKHLREVAANFTQVSAAIRDGKIITLESATSHASRLNAVTLGSDVVAWNGWLLKIGYAVDKLEDDGTIRTVQEKAAVFDQISIGLNKFADTKRVAVKQGKPAIVCVDGTCWEVAP